jgi:hypothetical protein
MIAKTDLVILTVAGVVIFGAEMGEQRDGRAAFERSEPLVARVMRILRRLRPSRRFMSIQWNEFQERELQERIADDE